MKRLSGLDAAFLYFETPSTPMHTMGVLLLESRQPHLTIGAIESLFLDRMHLLPPLRQRVIEVPLGLDHPVLVADPEFDVRNHVTRVHWDEPGTLEDVDWAAGVLASRPLDRGRPLWQVWWFDNLVDGGSALVTKLHHAITDGVSSARFMAQMLDTHPEIRSERTAPRRGAVTDLPSASTLALRAVLNQTRKSAAAAGGIVALPRELQKWWSSGTEKPSDDSEPRSFRDWISPHTDFNGRLSTKRSISRGSASLEDFKYVRKSFDATINDVLLAAVTLALGKHFAANGGAPGKPLTAAIPMSTRGDEDELGGNHVSALLVSLPVNLTRAEEVIQSIRRGTRSAKIAHEALPSGFVETVLDYAPPTAMKWLARQHERFGLADLHPPPCNLIVSNLAGPAIPLYCAGAPVRATYPIGPLINGSGLNLTVMSYNGRMDMGLIACPTRMPHAERFVANLTSAVKTLCEAAADVGRREQRIERRSRRRREQFLGDEFGASIHTEQLLELKSMRNVKSNEAAVAMGASSSTPPLPVR